MIYNQFKEQLKQIIKDLNITDEKVYLKFEDGYTYTAYISTKSALLYQCPLSDLSATKLTGEAWRAFATKTGYVLSRGRKKEEPSQRDISFEEIIENVRSQYANAEDVTPVEEAEPVVEAEPLEEEPQVEPLEEDSTSETQDVPVDDTQIEETELSEEDSEFNKKFNAIADKMYDLPKGKVMFSVAKMHYKDKPKDADAFRTIWNNLESCTTEQPYTVDKLQDWLEQGSVIVPFAEIEGIRYYTLLIFDIDNDNQELLDKLNDGKPFTMRDIVNHYDPILNTKPLLYYETYSSTSDNLRFRLILELDSPLSQKEYVACYKGLSKEWGAIVHNKKGKEVYKSVIDSSIGASRHVVFGTNKETMLYEDWGTVKVESLLPMIEAELGKNYSKETTYSSDVRGIYLPIRKIVELTDEKLQEYKNMKDQYIITDVFKLFDIVSYYDVFSWLFPHKLEGAKGQLTYCPFCETKKPHHGFLDAGNCGVDFRDDCPVPLNDKGYHAIHVNDLIKLYYGIDDNEVAYFILCDMLGVGPVNEYNGEYIAKKPKPKNTEARAKYKAKQEAKARSEKGKGKEAQAGDGGSFTKEQEDFMRELEEDMMRADEYLVKCPKPPQRITGLMWTQGIIQVIGKAKSLKTVATVIWLCDSVVKGECLKEHYATEQIGFHYYSYEGNLSNLIEFLKSRYTPEEWAIINKYCRFKDGRKLDKYAMDMNYEELELLFKFAQKDGANVIVFDPMNKALQNIDRKNEKELIPVLKDLEQLSVNYNISVVTINHASGRDGNFGNTSSAKVSGSEGVNRSVSLNLIYDRLEQTKEEKLKAYESSNEENNKQDIHIVISKEMERYGNIGYTKYEMTINFATFKAECKRWQDPDLLNDEGELSQRVSRERRLEHYYYICKWGLHEEVGKEFNKQELAEWLHQYVEIHGGISNISVDKIKNEYMKELVPRLIKDKILSESRGRNRKHTVLERD